MPGWSSHFLRFFPCNPDGDSVVRMKYALIAIAVGLCIFGYRYTTSYEEASLRKTTEWGFEWDLGYVHRVVSRLDSPTIDIEVTVLPGETTSLGVPYVFVDTLVVTVSGPRQEVRETLVTLDQLIY